MGINIRQFLIGKPLATNQAIHQRLTKVKALAVFSSDALSSSAYATEAILLVLVGAGTGALGLSLPIAIGIAALLLIVAFSYFQTIHAYPNGGGAYIVAKDNLGTGPGLVAAASLLIDYTLTVAVSVSAGVAAITSTFTALDEFRVPIALFIVTFITIINLRGVKESGTFFSIPTYMFVVGILAMIAYGVIRVLTGNIPDPEEGQVVVREATAATSGLTLFIILRAYAAGCTALTGVEAISNGIPAFKPPESKNAGQTLIVMISLLVTMFVGITFLANFFPIEVHEGHMESTILAQINAEIFGEGSILFFYIQLATLLILSLAANTAFADFPRLASLIAGDRYLPRQLTNWGDRLVYSNGIVMLSVMAGILIVIFGAREHNLLPLYAVGVFISFTLSQTGMVIHWLKERDKEGFKPDFMWRFRLGLNAFGALCTAVVGVILMVTKFTEGAWIVMVAIPILIWLFITIHNHYQQVAASLTLDGIEPGVVKLPTGDRNHVPIVVLMNSLNRCSLQALEYALNVSDNVHVCAIEVEPQQIAKLREKWEQWGLTQIPLDVIKSPYREIGRPLIEYLHKFDDETHDKIPTMVMLPEFVVSKWWERLLHNATSVTIREALYHDQIERGRGRPVINVPYRIGDELYQPDMVGGLAEEEKAKRKKYTKSSGDD
ncbi:MAG: APC family permease [Chloroflexi bacterium]|nr:MAG: APC family permease [Chloroflexota bacterium]